MNTPTFYDAIKHLEHTHHESDLYLVASIEANEIMRRYGETGELFIDNVTAKLTYHIPFAYQPFWDEYEARKAAQS